MSGKRQPEASGAIHICHRCGARDEWREGWHWYGSAWPTDKPQRILCPDCSRIEVDKVITP